MTLQPIDRMAVIIVYRWQLAVLMDALSRHHFFSTIVDATGGLLREGMVTLVVGTAAQRLPTLLSTLRNACPASTRYLPFDDELEFPWYPECETVVVRVGGANAFIIAVEQFIQL